ncbi:MAG: trans-aconitate 2-methyltransferase [Candidatus Nanohaloarchaea archaeon]
MRDEVKKGYEEGDYESEYREDRELQRGERELLDRLLSSIPDGGRVLDLGSGLGVPFDRYIVDQGYQVVGVDIAEKHVEKARDNVPEARFITGDLLEQDFEEDSFDAVVSFYSIFHIPRKEHAELFQEIQGWMKESGALLVTMGSEEMDMVRGEIGGTEMLWSSYSREKNMELVEEQGFEVKETYLEDWREETHLWLLAEPALK